MVLVAWIEAFCGKVRSTRSSGRSEDGKNWLGISGTAKIEATNNANARGIVSHLARIAPVSRRAIEPQKKSFLRLGRLRRRQDEDTEQRRKDDRDEPRHDERHRDHGEQREGVFAGRACGETNGNESGNGDKRAGQHGDGIGSEGERCRIDDVIALRKPAESVASVVVIASSTSNASAMMSAPSDMRCMSMPVSSISEKTMASVSGMASAMTKPGRTPRLMKLTARMIATACHSEVMKSEIACSTVTA